MLTVRPGDVFVHPTGPRAVVVSASEDVLELEMTLPPKTGRLPEHDHPRQAETFRVLNGSGAYRLGGVEARASAGDVVEVPLGARHCNLWNDGATELVFRHAIRPPLDFIEIATRRVGYRRQQAGSA